MNHCADCGAEITSEEGCSAYFHQMLYREHEYPALGVVHHLMVLCYHIQHPHLYSAEGLRGAVELLRQFVEAGKSPAQMRQQIRRQVDSGQRGYKIKASGDSVGAHRFAVRWTMTAQDVVAGGSDHYIERVEKWARTMLDDLRTSDNLLL